MLKHETLLLLLVVEMIQQNKRCANDKYELMIQIYTHTSFWKKNFATKILIYLYFPRQQLKMYWLNCLLKCFHTQLITYLYYFSTSYNIRCIPKADYQKNIIRRHKNIQTRRNVILYSYSLTGCWFNDVAWCWKYLLIAYIIDNFPWYQ